MPGPSPAPPAPGQPAPRQPAPRQPAPRQPAPRQPAPRQPAPCQPAPCQPAPRQPSPRSPGQTGPTAKPGGSFFFEAGRRGQVVVITDSSASAGVGGEDSIGVSIVPLRVLAGSAAADDDGPSGQLSPAIAAEVGRGERLTTARPAPEHFAAVYRLAASARVPAIVSVHLAAELSGTIGSARLAAAGAAVPVQVVDSRTIGAGLGFVAAAASRAARAGQSAAEVARAADGRAAQTVSFFALDTEEHLRAGGRLSTGPGGPGLAGPAGAIAGAAPGLARSAGRGLLASRPLLRIADGTITILERVRTRAAARDRLIELAADAAAALPGDCQLAVQFLGSRDEATELQRQLTATIPATGRCPVVRASTAILAHTGPGLLSVIIAPAL